MDSEPLWHEAEVDVLGRLGVPIAAAAPRVTKGMFVNEVTRFWYERFPWAGPGPDRVADQVVDTVTDLILARGVPREGVAGALGLCRRHGLRLALASSSPYRLIHPVVGHLGLTGTFDVVCSAEDEPYGKPHPGVFLTAAARLGVPPDRCVVWEDSPAGVLAAKAARMTCVAVPDAAERRHPAVGLADAVLASLAEADEELWHRLAAGRATGVR